MWKINCWLASLSAMDTHFNSAVLRQLHVPAHPAPRSWHFPLVPLKSGFIVPGAGGRNKRMPELWAGWQRLRNSSWARRGPLAPQSEGRTPLSAPCLAGRCLVLGASPGPAPKSGSGPSCSALGIRSLQPGLPHDAPAVATSPAHRPRPPVTYFGDSSGKAEFHAPADTGRVTSALLVASRSSRGPAAAPWPAQVLKS